MSILFSALGPVLHSNAMRKRLEVLCLIVRNPIFEYLHPFTEGPQMLHLGILENCRIQPRPPIPCTFGSRHYGALDLCSQGTLCEFSAFFSPSWEKTQSREAFSSTPLKTVSGRGFLVTASDGARRQQ